MRAVAMLVIATSLVASPLAAQSLPVNGDQSVDTAALIRLLGPVIQSLGSAQNASLDNLNLTSHVGAGDISQFAEIFKGVGMDGPMKDLLSSLGGVKGFDFSGMAKTAPLVPSATLGAAAGGTLPISADTLAGLAAAAPTSATQPAPTGIFVAPPAGSTSIYRSTDTVNGKTIPKYSNVPASSTGK